MFQRMNIFPHAILLSLIRLTMLSAHAETVLFSFDNVMTSGGQPMTGIFSWTYTPGDFENGNGQFLSLEIPWTNHNQDDLNATFDIGSSVEITLEGSVHDDGVDITLFLSEPLSLTTSAAVDLVRSKYEIGGNGFHDGTFLSGTISPLNLTLTTSPAAPGFLTIAWAPDLPGFALQESGNLSSPPLWLDSPSGSTNPAVVPVSSPTKFYRVTKP